METSSTEMSSEPCSARIHCMLPIEGHLLASKRYQSMAFSFMKLHRDREQKAAPF